MEFRYIKGIPQAIFPNYVSYINLTEKANFAYALRWSSSLAQYFETCEWLNEYGWPGVLKTITDFGYQREPVITQIGDFSVKGDTIYLWPPGFSDPVRITFFGEKIERVERYDLFTGRKIETYQNLPVYDLTKLTDKPDWDNIHYQLGQEKFSDYSLISLPQFSANKGLLTNSSKILVFDFIPPALYFKRFDLLTAEVTRLVSEGYKVAIISRHSKELPKEIKDYTKHNESFFNNIPLANLTDLEIGFSSEKLKKIVFTDREIFGTIFLTRRKSKAIKSSEAQKLLTQLEGEIEVGDYIVHEDYGVGIYRGLTIENDSDYLKLEYAEGDELFVPLDQLSKLTKYIGDESINITRLGKGEWNNLYTKVKAGIAITAQELARHYAQVKIATATPVEAEDSPEYYKFVAEFIYTPTADQLKSERDIIGDLIKSNPMNRLMIGDVGYGKTEVMLRAAYKMLEVGKQVVILCPTTVLAIQHYQTCLKRFKNTNFKIALLSRYNKPSKNKEILLAIADGQYDLIIGTHRILSSDFLPKALGMLIVDEEQRFGVKQKEKIKKLEYGVHTLAVSATPIPRTLGMALAAIQDISLIQTPPPGRLSVITTVEKLNWQKVIEAISAELARDGQVFFIHNEILTIESIRTRLQSLLPGVRFAVIHGRISGEKVDRIMTDFYQHKYDCLISTTIIENGVDMPKVNTLLVNNSQNLGLAQMYQLRGRVGRSAVQAYAYFLYTGKNLKAGLEVEEEYAEDEQELKKKSRPKYLARLEAILSAQSLGSGFKVASRDLEIRGAGNLLGKEQHGNISKIGYGLYMQMLAEEIERIKELQSKR